MMRLRGIKKEAVALNKGGLLPFLRCGSMGMLLLGCDKS